MSVYETESRRFESFQDHHKLIFDAGKVEVTKQGSNMKFCKHCNIDLSTVVSNGFECKSCKNYLSRYGMNRVQVAELHKSQNGCCAICNYEVKLGSRRKGDSGYIDHCHETGRVRGILCHPCNTQIGYFERKKVDFASIIKYIAG